MKCFTHPGADAVGIGKHCNKGVGLDCAVDVGGGIACKGKCESQVKVLIDAQQRVAVLYQTSRSVYRWLAVSMFVVGVAFELVGLNGLLSERTNRGDILGAGFGVVLCIGAFAMHKMAKKMPIPS